MLCLGTWAVTQKAGNWRFELYYYDFAIGVVLCAVVAALTLGSLHSQDLTFQDILLIAGRRQMAWAVAAGLVFNLGNMLLLAAMQVSGMAVAFPIAFGMALSIGAMVNYFSTPGANALLLFSGAVLGLIAVAVCAYTHGSYSAAQRAPAKPLRPDPRSPRAPRPTSPAAGVALAIFSGIVLTLSYPVLDWARDGEGAVTSYGLALLFSGGMLVSTILFSPFFMTFPVQGSPVAMRNFFAGKRSQHLWGILGGAIFMAGLLAAFACRIAPAGAQPAAPVTFAFNQASTIVAALWGLLILREFKGAGERAGTLMAGMLVLLAAGIGVVAVAPLYMK